MPRAFPYFTDEIPVLGRSSALWKVRQFSNSKTRTINLLYNSNSALFLPQYNLQEKQQFQHHTTPLLEENPISPLTLNSNILLWIPSLP